MDYFVHRVSDFVFAQKYLGFSKPPPRACQVDAYIAIFNIPVVAIPVPAYAAVFATINNYYLPVNIYITAVYCSVRITLL